MVAGAPLWRAKLGGIEALRLGEHRAQTRSQFARIVRGRIHRPPRLIETMVLADAESDRMDDHGGACEDRVDDLARVFAGRSLAVGHDHEVVLAVAELPASG